MQDQQSPRRIPVGIAAGLSALVVTAGSAAGFLAWHSSVQEQAVNSPAASTSRNSESEPQPMPSSQAFPSPTAVQPTQPKVAPAPTETLVQLYYLKDSGGEMQPTAVPLKLKPSGGTEAALTTAIATLLTEPSDKALTSVIPAGTQLRSLKVEPNGIHIDLSQAFTAGGGSASMVGRVAQILYTATSLKPTAPVFLSVEGKPLETLGGEGLMLSQPMTRQEFEQELGGVGR